MTANAFRATYDDSKPAPRHTRTIVEKQSRRARSDDWVTPAIGTGIDCDGLETAAPENRNPSHHGAGRPGTAIPNTVA